MTGALLAAAAASAKGGTDTVVLDVGDVIGITGAFVITSGSNPRLVKAIAEEVEAKLKVEPGISPIQIEGAGGAEWILMDYGDFVVHVFGDETRGFFQLEHLWADVPRLAWEPVVLA